MKGCKILNQDESNNNIMKIGKNMGEYSGSVVKTKI